VIVDEFNTAKEAFEAEQDAYNTARTAENDRRGDFFANAFDPVIAVPHRPSAPWTPNTYSGPAINYDAPASGALDGAFYFEAIAARQSADSTVNARLAKYDVVDSEDNFSATGKVFGINGQGTANMPADGVHAYYAQLTETTTGISASNQAIMMVSIFPTVQAQTGLATRNITIQAGTTPFFANYTEMNFMAAAPVAAEVDLVASVDGAKALTAGVALAAVALSLF